MTDTGELRKVLIERLLDGAGTAPRSERRAAFENAGLAEPLTTLVHKVATQPDAVTDTDIAVAREAGFSEDQIFEIVVCAAVGQATRQSEAAARALHLALGKA